MNIGDDDEDALAGTEGEGTEGQDAGSDGGKTTDLPAEQPDVEEDDGEPEEVAPAAGARPSRGEARIQRLANEAKAAREEAAAARREAEELRRQQWQRQEQISAAEEEQRRALMTDAERSAYDLNKVRNEFSAQLRQTQLQSQFTADKMAYESKAASRPVYAKHADEVERRFQEQVRRGAPVERETILKHLLGELALNMAAQPSAQRRQARNRVESQRVAAGSGKGDTASDRGKAGDSPAKRLTGVFI